MAIGDGDDLARSSEVVGRTARLVEYLRNVVTARRQQVHDVEVYTSALWLADLPADVDVGPDAVRGESLLSIEPVLCEAAPELPDELVGWVGDRDRNNSTRVQAELT